MNFYSTNKYPSSYPIRHDDDAQLDVDGVLFCSLLLLSLARRYQPHRQVRIALLAVGLTQSDSIRNLTAPLLSL